MPNLYEIATELAIVEGWIREGGGELTEGLEQLLDEAKMPFVVKIENIGKFSKNLKANIKALKEEEARLASRRKSMENKEKRIIKWAKKNMERVGTTRVEFTAFNAVIKKNPPSVEIVNEDEVPAGFKTIIPQTFTIDKKALLKALKEGKVAGARLITDKTRLEIK